MTVPTFPDSSFAEKTNFFSEEKQWTTELSTPDSVLKVKTSKVSRLKSVYAKNDARPAFQRMIADAKSGAFQYIIVYMFDRFARNRRDSIMYKEMLKEEGIKVLSALEPIAEDEGGEFYEMFLEWNAEKYSKRLSKRVRDGLDISAANGSYCGGTLIYGYKLENEPIPGKPNKF